MAIKKEQKVLPRSGVPSRPAARSAANGRWLAALSGAGIGLGWTVPFLAPLLPVAWFGFLRALARARSGRDAVRLGLAFGAGKYIVGSHFLLVLIRYSPLAIVFYLLAIVYILPFSVLEGGGAYALERRTGVPRSIAYAVLWVVSEKLRTLTDLAFPADLMAHGYAGAPAFLGLASLVGTFGITLLGVAVAVLAERALLAWPRRGTALAWGAAACALFVAPVLATVASGPPAATARELRVGIVQPAVALEDKVTEARTELVWQRLRALTREAARGADLVVWPETARPKYSILREGRIEDPEMAALAKDAGVPILYGVTIVGDALYNGAALVLPDGSIPQWYGKQHLLPLVEGVPFGRYFGWDPRARAREGKRKGYLGMLGNYAVGPEPTVFRVAGARIGVMVCFESQFPELGRAYRRAGANALAVLTNDAWWGHSIFAPWHARMVAVRARELGIPVLRAANNGISGIVASDGRTVARTELDERRVLHVTLPLSDAPPTLYAAWGDWFPALALFAIAALAVRGAFRRRRPV